MKLLLAHLIVSLSLLAPLPAPGGVVNSKMKRDLRLGDRFGVENILIDIFGDSINKITFENIIKNSTIFGGPCDIYKGVFVHNKEGKPEILNRSAACFSGLNDFKLPLIGKSSVLRAAWLSKTCHEIVGSKSAIDHALEKIGNRNRIVSKQELAKAYKSFYPLKSLGTEEMEILLANRELTWKDVYLAFCLSFGWQVE